MFKRIISTIICIALVILMCSPVFAISSSPVPSPTTSMEDILTEYHARSAAVSFESANATTYSLTASADQKAQIKQETISKLANAGYEAYDVNPDNFHYLENSLQTDFSDIGLDPNGSYIIVISGEDGVKQAEPIPQFGGVAVCGAGGDILPPIHEWDPDTPSGNVISHTYNGTTYYLRYLTVTADDFPSYGKASTYNLLESKSLTLIANCLDTAIGIYLDTMTGILHLGTVASICGLSISNIGNNHTTTLNLNAGTNWTRIFTQVWDDTSSSWSYRASVESRTSFTYIGGLYYNAAQNAYCPPDPKQTTYIVYSEHYNDTTWRKDKAVIGYLNNHTFFDLTGDAEYTYGGRVVITHAENI